MNRKWKVLLAISAIALMFLSLGANVPMQADASYTWYNDRESVAVNKYNVTDGYLNTTRDYGAWASAGDENISGNLSLPVPMSDATSATWYVYNNDTDATNINLTYNGVLLADNNTVSSGVEWSGSCTVGSHDEAYVNWSFNASDAQAEHTFLNFTIQYETLNITKTAFVTGTNGIVDSINERYQTHPTVELDSDESWYSVEDRVSVNVSVPDSTNVSVDLSGVTLYLSMPSHATNTPSDITIGQINGSTALTNYMRSYQKKGPYVDTIGDPTQDEFGDYELGMRVKAYEDEKDVDWTVNPEGELSEYFPDFDYDTLTITKDGSTTDWEQGSILLEGKNYDSGLTQMTFGWTPEEEEEPPIEPTEEAGIGNVTILMVTLGIVGAISIVGGLLWRKQNRYQ